MSDKPVEKSGGVELPDCAAWFIRQVIRKMRYTRRARREVQAELTAHFEDELRDCPDAGERDRGAQRLIEEFGDARLLATLCRRAKKRCRPLWVRTLRHTTQAIGVFLLVFIPYTIWFVRGKPHPTIDYLPQLNALNPPSGRVEDNAWPYYERAMRLVVEPNEAVKKCWSKSIKSVENLLTPQERARLVNWIAINSPAWLQFEVGAGKSYCHRTYRRLPGKPLIMSTMDDPPLGALRALMQIGLWRSRFAVEQGRTDDGLGYCLTLIRAGGHMEGNAFAIEELIAYAIGASACQQIRAILSSNELSSSRLSELQADVVAAHRRRYPPLSLEGERFIVLDAIEYEFTNKGLGGGHHVAGVYTEIALAALDVPDIPENRRVRMVLIPLDIGASMIHAGRTRTIAKANQLYDRMSEMAKHTPYERRVHNLAEVTEGISHLEELRYGMVYLRLVAERRASEIRFRAKADDEAVVTILAVKRHRLEIGAYPLDLKTLVDTGYLDEVPMDPFSDGPLIYRLAGDNFILYSVGRDFDDDGGEPGRDSRDKAKMWAETGDAVFWPVNP